MNKSMPDVVKADKPDYQGKLRWVGMDEVEVPVCVESSTGLSKIAAKANIYVNLIDENAKGIHMSRLFVAIKEGLQDKQISPIIIEDILEKFLASHEDISDQAKIEIQFDYLTERSSLLSGNSGWRTYPIHIIANKNRAEKAKIEMGIGIQYSSTCPCSAALSRQLNQENFLSKFGEKEQVSVEEISSWLRQKEAIAATPHAQRSLAKVFLEFNDEVKEFNFTQIINEIEKALGTPVQTVVKREDEQEFARLNAENLMFSEDAARRIQKHLNTRSDIKDFHGKVSHFESLHPHDAVCYFQKNY